MSIIASGVTTTTALVSTGTTDGTLQFQVNGTTPSLTLNALGAFGVGATPGYGTSGQVLTSQGSNAAPVWAAIVTGTNIVRSTYTANYTLAAADKGNLVVATANSFTFSFTAAATLGSGWCVYIQNAGTGDITLDPNGSETIDGLTSYIMYPGEARLIQCDGTGFNSIVLNAFAKTFTASGTFIKPPGYSYFEGMLWGGGSGAKWASFFDGSTTQYAQLSGGGGGCMPFMRRSSDLSASETVTVGAGGTRNTTNYFGNPETGGNTVFAGITGFGGSSLRGGGTANGATSGQGQYSPALSPTVSTTNVFVGLQFLGSNAKDSNTNPTIPSLSYYGGGGGAGTYGQSQNTSDIAGGFSYYGGGGGASNGGARGGSVYGGRGGDASNAPEAPGGGAFGSSSGVNGNGARGEVRVWGII